LVTLDPEGNRTSIQTPKGPTTAFEYDELGKLTKVTQPAVLVHASGGGAPTLQTPVTSYAYDENRNRIRQTDANGHVVAMEYDELNRLKKTTQDTGGLNLVTETLKFDENGNPEEVVDPKGQKTTSTFDELNRLKTKSFAFAPGDPVRPWRYTAWLEYGYDENGNLRTTDEHVASGTSPPDTTLSTSRTYDHLDRLESETQPLPDGGTRTVGYTYYKNGLRKTVTDPAGSVSQYAYDGQNRLETAITGFGTADAATTVYTYWPDDLLKTVTYPNGVVATHDYDKADRLLTLANAKGAAPVSSYTYSYDPNGNRLSQVEVNGGRTETTGYGYDDLDRLASVTYPVEAAYPQGRVVTYGYDAVGNRIRETEKDSADTLLADKQGVFDHANRLTELQDLVSPADSTSFTWDPNGNQTSKATGATTTEYRYDLRDKLVEVVQGPSTLGRFQYDADGRRNLKIGEEGLRQYVYDQTSLLVEYDATCLQKAKYDYGSDRLISLTRADEGRRYFSLDGLHSVVNLTDDSGGAVASYHLDAWGSFRFPSELDASRNRFAFTGHIFDTETGLYAAKARYFDPKLGRFLTQDSYLGQIDEPPSLHRYVYGWDRPTYFVDPTGHAPEEAGKRVYVCDSGGCRTEIRKPPSVEEAAAPEPVTRDVEGHYPPWLNQAIAEARRKRLEGGVPGEESVAPESAERTVTEDLGLEATGDPAIDAILKQQRDTKAALGNVGEYGKAAGQFGLSLGSGTAGDIATATTGIDPVTGEKVDRLTRGMAAAGIIIPGVSGHELKVATELAERAAKAKKPFRELLNADELRRFEQLKEKYPDFMPGVETAARVLSPAEVREARKRASRGGHHRHPLAFEGKPKPPGGLVPTGDTVQRKGQEHKEVTNFWNEVLRRLRNEEKM
jgi:RHS repeat-associated protein